MKRTHFSISWPSRRATRLAVVVSLCGGCVARAEEEVGSHLQGVLRDMAGAPPPERAEGASEVSYLRAQRGRVANELAALEKWPEAEWLARPRAELIRELHAMRRALARAREHLLLVDDDPALALMAAVRDYRRKWGSLPARFLKAERFDTLPQPVWLRVGGHAGVPDPVPIKGDEWAGLCHRALRELARTEKAVSDGYRLAQRLTSAALDRWALELDLAAGLEAPEIASADSVEQRQQGARHLRQAQVLGSRVIEKALDQAIARLTREEDPESQFHRFLCEMKARSALRHEDVPALEALPMTENAWAVRLSTDDDPPPVAEEPSVVPPWDAPRDLGQLTRRLYTVHFQLKHWEAIAARRAEAKLAVAREEMLPGDQRLLERWTAEQTEHFRERIDRERARINAEIGAEKARLREEVFVLVQAIARAYDAQLDRGVTRR